MTFPWEALVCICTAVFRLWLRKAQWPGVSAPGLSSTVLPLLITLGRLGFEGVSCSGLQLSLLPMLQHWHRASLKHPRTILFSSDPRLLVAVLLFCHFWRTASGLHDYLWSSVCSLQVCHQAFDTWIQRECHSRTLSIWVYHLDFPTKE